jgi:type II secretory pathway predicted ATPase ExeA
MTEAAKRKRIERFLQNSKDFRLPFTNFSALENRERRNMNYNTFFGFSDSPFLDVPDLRFLFLTKEHDALLSELVEFISARRGIAVLSGDDGVGKTMLAQTLIQRLPQGFQPLALARPEAEPLAIALMIGQALGLNLQERNVVNLNPLTEAVQAAAQQDSYYALLLDDAHLLTDQHLEEIYVLSQMACQDQQLMPIILTGRKGLVQKLASAANQRLQGLIQKNLVLLGLPFEETGRYIDHRLQKVGSSYQACFADGCTGQLFSRTGGIPRRINQVCDQALTRAWQANRPRVSRDLLGEKEPNGPYNPLAPPPRRRLLKISTFLAGALLAGLAGSYVYLNYFSPALKAPPPVAATPAPPPQAPKPAPEAPAPLASLPATSPAPPANLAESRPQPQVDESLSRSPAPPPPAPPPIQESASSREPAVPEAAPPPPPSFPGTAEPEAPESLTHRVSAEDGGLLKIAAARYPENREPGYDAIILANPQINDEDVIYKGQMLILPIVDKNSKLVTLPNKQHYAMFQRYYNSSQMQKDLAKIKDLGLKFTIRETTLYGDHRVYRIFLGGYDSKAELQKAMELVKKN